MVCRLLVLLVACFVLGPVQAAPSFDIAPAQGVLKRLLPQQAAQIELGSVPPAGSSDYFRISAANGHVRVEGSTVSSLLFGVNWYLKYVAQAQISPNGDQLPSGNLPLPDRVIEGRTPYRYRYALNENVDGYTTAYWDWPRWQREIDVLALSGINAILIERGTDTVLYRTFRDFGYSDTELRNWIALPAHQNWQLMGNLCCYNGPISQALLQRRAASAKQIIGRLRELGITPVLPGFFGIVPGSLKTRFPRAHIVPQGEWAGFERPDWLDPRDPLFTKMAARFYAHQRELFGRSAVYDMEVFQEGGDAGAVPVATAAKALQTALDKANPGALWMMMAWQGNPRQDLLAGVDRSRLLIVDIDHDRAPRDHRQADFQGAPFLFGGIWEFGGRTTLGANVDNITARLQRLGRTNSNMVGTAIFTEGMDTNPFAYDLFTEMAWRREPVDVAAWTADYVRRRYGDADRHALAAWQVLIRTAYNIHIDLVTFNSERDAAQESLFNAQPSLTTNRASHWSPEALRYDAQLFKTALPQLLAAAPTAKNFTYDLVDVARQTLANESRLLLPQIRGAFERKDAQRFEQLTDRWLHLMDLQDELLRGHPQFMLGNWLNFVPQWASTPEELVRLQLDARSLLTTWGDRHASEAADLHDYGNKDWSGLTADYYKARWQAYFESLKQQLRTGAAAAPIDWFAFGERWNRDTRVYPSVPTGDARQIAGEIAQEIGRNP
ncbi:MAG: alpha-N-acetylglucosaminidase [Proteobacteria bacterium]|nr:alpha-N-acetylglucosaminidase [Pseudomonadota bacterium]